MKLLRRAWNWLATLALAVWLIGVLTVAVTSARAGERQPLVVKTGYYQLDTGAGVIWWFDEPRALLCLQSSAGLSCLPLAATPYNWPALPEN